MHSINVAETYFSLFITRSTFRSDDVLISSHFRSYNNHNISNDDVNNAHTSHISQSLLFVEIILIRLIDNRFSTILIFLHFSALVR